MSAITVSPFSVQFTQIMKWLDYESTDQIVLDMKRASLIQSQDYEVIDGEVMLSRDGLKKLILVCTTAKAQTIKSQFSDASMPLLEGDAPIELNPKPIPNVSPKIKWTIDRAQQTAWGEIENHLFYVSNTKNGFFYNVPDWSFPDEVIDWSGAKPVIKPEVINYALNLING